MAIPLNATTRYIHPGVSATYWLDSVAAPVTGPSRPELDAAVDLTKEIADMPGWMKSSNRVPTMDLGTDVTAKVRGRTELPDSQIVFWGDEEGNDIRSLLSERDRGWIWIAHGGDVAGRLADLWEVEVLVLGHPINVAGDAADRITVDFSHPLAPWLNLVIPA